eukprot:6221930-Prymnesium_polylepis.1
MPSPQHCVSRPGGIECTVQTCAEIRHPVRCRTRGGATTVISARRHPSAAGGLGRPSQHAAHARRLRLGPRAGSAASGANHRGCV